MWLQGWLQVQQELVVQEHGHMGMFCKRPGNEKLTFSHWILYLLVGTNFHSLRRYGCKHTRNIAAG